MTIDSKPYSASYSTTVDTSSIPTYISTLQSRSNKWSKELDDASIAALVTLRDNDADSARAISPLLTEFGNGIGLWFPCFNAVEKLKAIAVITEFALLNDGKSTIILKPVISEPVRGLTSVINRYRGDS
jgi:hypothetical protein